MISGRRLTSALLALLAALSVTGGFTAWTVGRAQAVDATAPAGYVAGPTTDRSVRVSDSVVDDARAGEIADLLDRYFAAINARDFEAWTRSVSSAQSAGQTRAGWLEEYSTTTDSNIVVARVDDDPLRVRVMFTSTQDPAHAPRSLPASCIDWDLTYLLADEGDGLVLSGIDPSAQSMASCG